MPRLLVCSSREEVFEDCCSKPYQFIQPDCVRACLIELFQSNYPDAINGMVSESYFGLRSRTNQDFLQDVQVLIDILYESYLGRASSAELGEDVASNDSEWARLSLRCISNTFRSRYSVNISDALIKAGLSDKNVISNTSPFFRLEPCGPVALPPISIDPPGVQQPECGTIEYELIGPEVDNGEWMINLVLSGQVDYPLGEVQYIIDGGPPTYGPMLNVGNNILGSFLLGQTVQIVIVNAANDECNIALPEIVTECPVIEVNKEVLQACDADPPSWGVLVTPTWTENFPAGSVYYETPLTGGPVAATPFGGGQYACGPLGVAADPGPMTIVVESGANKACMVPLGPFEPGECDLCSLAQQTEGCQYFSFEVETPCTVAHNYTDPQGQYITVVRGDGSIANTYIDSSDPAGWTEDILCAYSSDAEGNPVAATWIDICIQPTVRSGGLDISGITSIVGGVNNNGTGDLTLGGGFQINNAIFTDAPDLTNKVGLIAATFTDSILALPPIIAGISTLQVLGITSLFDTNILTISPVFSGNPALRIVHLTDNQLPTTEVNAALVGVSGTSLVNDGDFRSQQIPSAAPSGAGLIAKSELEGRSPGWTVIVDP